LKGLGAAAGVGAIAGCSGGDGGDGSDGGGDGGDGGGDGGDGGMDTTTTAPSGDGGDGSDGGDGGDGGGDGGTTETATMDLPDEIQVTFPPTGWWAVLGNIMENNDLIQKYKNEHGVDTTYNIKRTWDGIALFASGKTQIAQFGSLESSRIGPERDTEITVFGKVVPQFAEMVVAAGGPYDPANTGGVQQSVDKLANEGGSIGIGAWGSGSVPGTQIAMDQEFGYNFSQSDPDFDIVTSGFFATAKLIVDGELAAGHTSPMLGGAPYYSAPEPKVRRLYHIGDAVDELGFGRAPLENQVCTTPFFEENTPVCRVYHDAMSEAISMFHEDPVGIITQSQEMIESLGVANDREATFTVNYGINLKNSFNDLEPPNFPSVYRDYTLDDEWISADKKLLDQIAAIGQTSEDWADYVNYEKMS
jgi:hypothetical protein